MDFTELVDLASGRLGGVALAANDEFFAAKENLLNPAKPVFIADKYTDVGKWMDGWETRRRRTPGFDWCVVRLGLPGILRGAIVDTTHFKGNNPEFCLLEACALEGQPTVKQFTDPSTRWLEILPKSPLQGDTEHRFAITAGERFTHVRLSIFPDGGVARLRLYGEVVPDWAGLVAAGSKLDLAAVEHGGLVVASSDSFFGVPLNLLMPGPPANMGDGWETRRRRGPGHDWVVIRLGTPGELHRIEVDTRHFKGNFPDGCSLDACLAPRDAVEFTALPWKEALPWTPLGPHARHVFEVDALRAGPASHVRFNIYPDGGVARLRIFGRPQRTER